MKKIFYLLYTIFFFFNVNWTKISVSAAATRRLYPANSLSNIEYWVEREYAVSRGHEFLIGLGNQETYSG